MQSDFCQLALNCAGLGIWDLDPRSGRYYGDQRCRDLFGVPEREIIHIGEVLEIVHPEDRERVRHSVEEALDPSSGGRYEIEYRVVWPDGATHWLYARGQAQFERNGGEENLRRFAGVLMDLTARKQLEEQLQDASRAKSEFLATMSHEIRTPMTVIMGSIEQMLLDEGDPNHRHLLEMAEHSAQRLLRIINDLLDISRIEARSLVLDEEPFELRQWLLQNLQMISGLAREKGVEVIREVTPQVPALICADPARLGQVLLNLVTNAIKFTQGGEVSVRVETRNDDLLFCIRDNGIGIPAEQQQLIFESFRQAGTTRSRSAGAGLGLAISRGLVELMGGVIWVESEPGRGSTFFFTLPLHTG